MNYHRTKAAFCIYHRYDFLRKHDVVSTSVNKTWSESGNVVYSLMKCENKLCKVWFVSVILREGKEENRGLYEC